MAPLGAAGAWATANRRKGQRLAVGIQQGHGFDGGVHFRTDEVADGRAGFGHELAHGGPGGGDEGAVVTVSGPRAVTLSALSAAVPGRRSTTCTGPGGPPT